MCNEVDLGMTLHVGCVCQYVQVIGSSLYRTLHISIATELIIEVSAGGGMFSSEPTLTALTWANRSKHALKIKEIVFVTHKLMLDREVG